MTRSKDQMERWVAEVFGSRLPSLPQIPAFKATPTPAERKRAQTAEAARQIIEADKAQRQANSARLRQVRLERDAQNKAASDRTSLATS